MASEQEEKKQDGYEQQKLIVIDKHGYNKETTAKVKKIDEKHNMWALDTAHGEIYHSIKVRSDKPITYEITPTNNAEEEEIKEGYDEVSEVVCSISGKPFYYYTYAKDNHVRLSKLPPQKTKDKEQTGSTVSTFKGFNGKGLGEVDSQLGARLAQMQVKGFNVKSFINDLNNKEIPLGKIQEQVKVAVQRIQSHMADKSEPEQKKYQEYIDLINSMVGAELQVRYYENEKNKMVERIRELRGLDFEPRRLMQEAADERK